MTKENVTLALVIVVGGFALIQVLLLLGVGLMDLLGAPHLALQDDVVAR